MRIKSILLSLSAVAALSASFAQASTNLIVNGDFNQTTNGNNNQVGYKAGVVGETMLTGWTSYNGNNGGYNFVLNDSQVLTDKSVKKLKSSYTPLTSGGNNFFASDPVYHPGVLSQTVSGLTSGTQYTLTFNYALAQQVGFDGPNTSYWKVLFGDAVTVNQIETNKVSTGTVSQSTKALTIADGGFSGWQSASMTFTANSASQVLSFFAEGTAPGAPPFMLLDNVSLAAAVPEPSTWGMLLGGLGLMGFMARRRAANRA